MKKRKMFCLFVLAFFVLMLLTSIFVGFILKCINNFIDLSDMIWFWRGLIISIIISIVGATLIVHSTKQIGETKLSFWLGKNYPKLLLSYVLVVLALASIKKQTFWSADIVYDVLSLQWTIFGLSLTVFLVWNVIMVEFLKNKEPKQSDSLNLFQQYTLVLKKKTYFQEVETTFTTAILLTINLFLLVISTSAIYVSAKPDGIITQNILLFSFFLTTNSILCLFTDILMPLKKDKAEMLKDNNVTKEDVDKAQAALFAQAIIDALKEGVMSLDPEKYTDDEKKELLIGYLEAFRDYVHSKETSKSDN